MSETELDEERENIVFKWNSDNMFSTFKRFDMLSERAEMLDKYMPLVGKLVSIDWIRKEILGQTDEDIQAMEAQMKAEKNEMKNFDDNTE